MKLAPGKRQKDWVTSNTNQLRVFIQAEYKIKRIKTCSLIRWCHYYLIGMLELIVEVFTPIN